MGDEESSLSTGGPVVTANTQPYNLVRVIQPIPYHQANHRHPPRRRARFQSSHHLQKPPEAPLE